MRLYVGTSGWAYPEWRGGFYPEKLSPKKLLAAYAERLPSVEANASFRTPPTAEQLGAWAAETPASFRFSVKAPDTITHFKRLLNCGEELAALYAALPALGRRQGPVLFQLPPNFKIDLGRLEALLKQLPRKARVAFEFRHASWFTDETYAVLRAAQAALCIAEADELQTPLVATADFGYLRLRKARYTRPSLRRWYAQLLAQPWSAAFVYFKHEETGSGPRYATLLAALHSAAESRL